MAKVPANPLVSVIVPNFNHEKFLGPRLESVFSQTLQDFEVIYLDDASTDNSNEVASRFENDPRMTMVVNQENSGSPFAQWNKGVALARGEFVWIAESDDRAEPALLEGLVTRLQENPSAGLAYCRSQPVDTSDRPLPDDLFWPDPEEASHWEADFTNNGRDEISRFLVIRCTIPNASAVVFRRELYNKVGGAPLDYRYAGDWVTWLKILLRSDVCYANQVWNYHRKHAATITSGAALDGRWAEEGYRVLTMISSEMEIPPTQLERVRDRLMVKWMSSWVHADSRIDEERQNAIFAVAENADPGLVGRAFRNIMISAFPARCRLVRDLWSRKRKSDKAG